MKKYTQKEAMLVIQGDEKSIKDLSSSTGIPENTLRQYRKSSRRMKAPVNLLFRLLLVSKQHGLLEKLLIAAGEVEIHID